MNFQQLEYVIAVDRHKHFARAAKACHITQATLSAMIKKLEQELGLVLFDRSKHPVKTTEAGQEILSQARDIIQGRNEMLSAPKITSSELTGEIRIGIIPTVANSLLPLILPEITSEFPKLHFNIVEITTEEIEQQLFDDRIDAGILSTPLHNELLEENVMYYEPMLVYGARDDSRKYINSAAVKNEKIWLLEEGNCFRNQSITLCDIKEKDLHPDNLSFEGSSFETLLNLTDVFGGFTLVPELYYKQMPENRKNRTKIFVAPIPVREISLVHHRPFAKKKSIDILSKRIEKIANKHLSTHKFSEKDLSIIGID